MATKLKASSKFGRNKVKCDKYKATGRREKNKARKQATMERRLARAAESYVRIHGRYRMTRKQIISAATVEAIRVNSALNKRLANT